MKRWEENTRLTNLIHDRRSRRKTKEVMGRELFSQETVLF
jgi:hypothetical protein